MGQSTKLINNDQRILFPIPISKFSTRKSVLILIFAALFVLSSMYFLATCISENRAFTIYYEQFSTQYVQSGACNYPRLNPWDPSIQEYTIQKPSPIVCKKLQPELTYLAHNGTLYINQTAAQESNNLDPACFYRCFNRFKDSDDELEYEEWVQFKDSVEPQCEFVDVQCTGLVPFLPIYTNTHAQIIVKNISAQNSSRISNINNQPSVIILVLDSVSRSNFIRQLPKTVKILEEQYSAVIMDALVKVGDNSLPNAAAFLTGLRYNTAGYKSDLPEDLTDTFADIWPLIWRDYKTANYTTYYAEDMPNINLFRYLAKGFQKPPTDHYFRPFWLKCWFSLMHRRSSHLCYGNQLKHKLQLNYLQQFLMKYASDEPKFALNWLTELGHDWLAQVALGDDDLAEFFTKVHSKLSNSWLVVLSDHGHRFDSIRQTPIGRIEERMPFMAIAPPANTNQTLRYILKQNSKILCSHFDVYATLRDILDGSGPNVRIGASLLRPLNPLRTCEDAGIPQEFCVCQRESTISTKAPPIKQAATKLVNHVNQILDQASNNTKAECSQLSLTEIKHAQQFVPPASVLLNKKSWFSRSILQQQQITYRVMIRVAPSQAIFEGTLSNSISTNQWSVIGDVNRLNRYGNQSHCVSQALLKKFCFCL